MEPREVIKVAHPIVDGNDQGFVLKYRDEMREDETEFVEGEEAGDEPAQRRPGRPRKE